MLDVAAPHYSAEVCTGRSLRVHSKAADLVGLRLEIETGPLKRSADEVIIEIAAAAVNPSDVKATLGLMPHARWPRTPGRDFAGVVVDGSSDLLGTEVWGSSGELGIQLDGTHGTHLVLPSELVREKPRALSLLEAGAVGVPFVTAWKGFERAGFPVAGDTIFVFGGNGKVGQAAIQIATMLGAKVVGVVREANAFDGHHSAPIEIVSSDQPHAAERLMDLTDGRGADVIFNTVGSPYFELASKTLGLRGRQILIATVEQSVPFRILDFYRKQHMYVGVDTLGLDTAESMAILAQLTPGFESGALKPFPINAASTFGLEDAISAYTKVLGSTRDRVVLVPQDPRR